LPLAREYELAVLHTSTPSFSYDVKVAEALRAEHPRLRIGFVGAHVAVHPEDALAASDAIEFVARSEFDFAIQEVAQGRPLERVRGLSYRANGVVRHTPERPTLEDMDALPFVVDVYRRDLTIEQYFIGYLLHPYVSLYTGRGCQSKCTFCLWPQTVGGQRYRTRSVAHVLDEMRETIEGTIRYACELDPHTIQVSIAAPYPGTALYREAVDGGWLRGPDLVSGRGFQQSALSYPHLSSAQIFEAVEAFYTRFYFRPRKLWAITREMARDRRLLGRRLREGVEFFRFLAQRGR